MVAPAPAWHRDAAVTSCETLPSVPELAMGLSRSSWELRAPRGEGSPKDILGNTNIIQGMNNQEARSRAHEKPNTQGQRQLE